MFKDKYANQSIEQNGLLDEITDALCHPHSLNTVWRNTPTNTPLLSVEILAEIMQRLKAAIFPGYFGKPTTNINSIRYHLAANLDSIYQLLRQQIVAGLCFNCASEDLPCANCELEGNVKAQEFMKKLPEIRSLLTLDAKAAYEGDPAARSVGETILCYPSLVAMLHYRISHTLYELDTPMIPRIISEMAHSQTGIDIHPGATIGKEFFIDHGTGVVIGETCIIGRGCRLYQGVTLGALSFPKNLDGTLTKGIARHPILEDNVTVYAGATILGRVTIGEGAVIGGNVWITEDVSPGAHISQN